MKKYFITLLVILLPAISYANDKEDFAKIFLDDPILKDSESVEREEGKLTFTTEKTHDEVLAFYKEKLKSLCEEEIKSFEDNKDWDEATYKKKLKYLEDNINYRDWDEVTYIEDDGRMPWHSITISKEMSDGVTTVIIAKDKWTWIMGTLIIRYIAVFVVLLVLFIGMKVSGAIISSTVNKAEAKKA